MHTMVNTMISAQFIPQELHIHIMGIACSHHGSSHHGKYPAYIFRIIWFTSWKLHGLCSGRCMVHMVGII